MDENAEQYLLFLKQKVRDKISSSINSKTIEDIIEGDLYQSHIKEKNSSAFQEYYFKTLNNDDNFLNNNFFKEFKSKYSLQGIDNNYLEKLENAKPEILKLIRANFLTKLYIDFFSKAKIKHGEFEKEKDLGSFFAKLVHHFLPNEYAALDNPIKQYFCLSKESFVLSFFIISEEYKSWAENNQEILLDIRQKFEYKDEKKIINHELLTDLKLLDLIFWSKANRNNTKKKITK
ncbi:hypothetical protein J3D55_004346 [Chryseobacterium ginsenosidimutans]|uniref:hypothetical protein n=1 Tax=Chryseobacterium ginsenosidimutans TaxID=687846 RepID=UPI0021696612|nr:hypothetical protein [Chryseobacterium ginsenosidimutans]MCS3871430.1 hypothetical protein [Chryseobacterium ginsenosidimutans]